MKAVTRKSLITHPCTILTALLLTVAPATHARDIGNNLRLLTLPQGFSIDIYADNVRGARSMAYDPTSSTLYVSTRERQVYAVIDDDKDYKADKVETILDGLNSPNGIALHQGKLYVAEQHRIVRYPTHSKPGLPLAKLGEVIHNRLPDKAHHGWRYIEFGPDGKLYVAVGVACNICDFPEPEGTILQMNPNGSEVKIFARGHRNSVGLAFHPVTGALYFTDNNTDLMGDDIPPGELNAAPKAGMHFGFPYYAGGHVQHRRWMSKKLPQEVTFPVIEFQAHVAALGVEFYTGNMFPDSYKNTAFVAQHGSWNRSTPVGYRLVHVNFDDKGEVSGHKVFAEGWLQNEETWWGRPVDILQLPDGSLLVSDDYLGVIYRITYTG